MSASDTILSPSKCHRRSLLSSDAHHISINETRVSTPVLSTSVGTLSPHVGVSAGEGGAHRKSASTLGFKSEWDQICPGLRGSECLTVGSSSGSVEGDLKDPGISD